jgi:hypothetical protein
MEYEDSPLLSAAENELKRRFNAENSRVRRMPSNAEEAPGSKRMESLILPDAMRPKMPYTKDKFLIRENPHLVQWEREVRKFLRQLSPDHGHRVSATMVYEWATGIKLVDVMESNLPLERGKQNWRSDIRKINRLLAHYFGTPFMTWIMGRKVHKAYRVRVGYYIKRHRPLTLTLYAEYVEGVLNP